MREIVIMRGIPGSGKTTLAKEFASLPGSVICSADDYFETPTGYHRDDSKLREAHEKCKEKFSSALKAQCPRVVVDNTNCRLWELAWYARAVEAAQYQVRVVTLLCEPAKAFSRCTHKVPQEACNAKDKALREDLRIPWHQDFVIA